MSSTSTTATTATTAITIHVKTMTGQILTIQAPVSVTHDEFYHLLHQAMDSSPDIAFLRIMDEDGQKDFDITDGATLFLFVEEPDFHVQLHVVDDARIDPGWYSQKQQEQQEDQDQGPRDMEVYQLEIQLDQKEYYTFEFYTPVYHPYADSGLSVKHYTNAYYHEDDIEILFNPSNCARQNEFDAERIIDIRPRASVACRPELLLLDCVHTRYLSYLQHKVQELWNEHTSSTGAPFLVPV
jgi:hypothetical protein